MVSRDRHLLDTPDVLACMQALLDGVEQQLEFPQNSRPKRRFCRVMSCVRPHSSRAQAQQTEVGLHVHSKDVSVNYMYRRIK